MKGVITMDFLELAKRRYSVRKYYSKSVEKEKLMKILEAGRVAPTAANLQPHRLMVVQEKDGLESLSRAANIYSAPLAIIICCDHNRAWKRSFDGKRTIDIDTSIVTDQMMLQATELGLGTVWICKFEPDIVRKEFNLPDNLEPINILAIGYAEGPGKSPERHVTERLPLSDIVFYEKYRGQ